MLDCMLIIRGYMSPVSQMLSTPTGIGCETGYHPPPLLAAWLEQTWTLTRTPALPHLTWKEHDGAISSGKDYRQPFLSYVEGAS